MPADYRVLKVDGTVNCFYRKWYISHVETMLSHFWNTLYVVQVYTV